MRKRLLLTVLVCANLVLLTGIALFAATPRTALAQGTGLAGNYLVVTGQIQSQFDALYMLDLRERTLHCFYFVKGTNNIEYAGYRDLERDFRNNP
jgi:hypothetical protein